MTNQANLADLLQEVLDDYDDTGCEDCGVISAELIEKIKLALADMPEPGAEPLIAKVKEAASVADDVTAVVEVNWTFVASLGFSKEEVESLDETVLRQALGEHVLEMISMTGDNAGDALDGIKLLEIRPE